MRGGDALYTVKWSDGLRGFHAIFRRLNIESCHELDGIDMAIIPYLNL